MTSQELGIYGERLARQFLIEKGFEHLECNYRFGHFEVDIISRIDNRIVVTEVKTRHTSEIGDPWRAVTRTKQKQIIKVANKYVQDNEIVCDTRFDIISIVHNSYKTEILHIEDAFTTV